MTARARALLVPVRVTARGGRDSIERVEDGRLLVRVAAAPVAGEANAAVERLIAAALSVPPTSVCVMRGATSRHKLVSVDGIEAAAVLGIWPDLGV